MPELPDPAAGDSAGSPEASEAERLADEFFHGDLDDEARARLAERLEADPEAARAFRETWRMEALLSAAHEQPGSAELARRIRDAKRGRPPLQTVRTRRVGLWAASAAAACLLLAAGLWLARGGTTQTAKADGQPEGPSAKRTYQVTEGVVLANGKQAETLASGDKLETSGGDALIRFEDGSRMRLDRASACTLHGGAGGAREVVELLKGSAGFEVQKGGGAFRVETALGKVTVLGTSFDVVLREPHRRAVPVVDCTVPVLEVSVAEGRVQVDGANAKAVLGSGQSREFGDEKRLTELEAFGGKMKGLQAAIGGKVVRSLEDGALLLEVEKIERVIRKGAAAQAPKDLVKQTIRVRAFEKLGQLSREEHDRVNSMLIGLLDGQSELTVAVEHAEGRTFDLLFAPVAPGDHSSGKCGCKK